MFHSPVCYKKKRVNNPPQDVILPTYCDFDRLEQSFAAHWFAEEFDGSRFQRPLARRIIRMSRDKNHRNVPTLHVQ